MFYNKLKYFVKVICKLKALNGIFWRTFLLDLLPTLYPRQRYMVFIYLLILSTTYICSYCIKIPKTNKKFSLLNKTKLYMSQKFCLLLLFQRFDQYFIYGPHQEI